jgi:hypothetical protein
MGALTSETADSRSFRPFELPGNLGCLVGPERPNVKDEPRRQPARRVQHNDHESLVSFRSTIKIARDVTDVAVGSGALLGRLGGCRNRVEERTWLIDWKRVRLSQKPRRVRRHERSRIVMMGEEMSQANRCGYLVRSARRATQSCPAAWEPLPLRQRIHGGSVSSRYRET